MVDTGFVDADVLKQYIQTHSPLDVTKFEPKNTIIFNNKADTVAVKTN